jgi:membrane protease YdiL (CAAX protease family)
VSVRRAELSRAGLLLAGLGIALAMRLALAGRSGVQSPRAGLLFAAGLIMLVGAAGWRPGRFRVETVAIGALGAAGLVALPTWLRWETVWPVSSWPVGALPAWAAVVIAIAAAEELLLRGVLFSVFESAWGTLAAVVITAIAFALLHVPLYGWGALSVDVAVGIWLGGLRVIANSVTAPLVAHVLADLAAWWLV